MVYVLWIEIKIFYDEKPIKKERKWEKKLMFEYSFNNYYDMVTFLLIQISLYIQSNMNGS